MTAQERIRQLQDALRQFGVLSCRELPHLNGRIEVTFKAMALDTADLRLFTSLGLRTLNVKRGGEARTALYVLLFGAQPPNDQ